MKKRILLFSLLYIGIITVILSVGATMAKYITTEPGTPFDMSVGEHNYYTYAVLIENEETDEKKLSIRNRKAVVVYDENNNPIELIDKDGTYALGTNGVVYALPYQQNPNNINSVLEKRVVSGKAPEGAIDDMWDTRWNTTNTFEASVTSVVITDPLDFTDSLACMFQSFTALKNIDFTNATFGEVISMRAMFDNCTNLTTITFNQNLNTSKVENTFKMFFQCCSLTTLDVSLFDVESVKDMSYMFNGCKSMPKLDVSNWNTSAVTDMNNLFRDCSSLTELDLTKWDTKNCKNMDSLVANCKGLTSLDVSGLDTGKVTTIRNMFAGCTGLTELNISTFDSTSLTDTSCLVMGCTSLSKLIFTGGKFDTSKVIDMDSMFKNCTGFETLDLTGLDTSSVTDMSFMFQGFSAESLNISGFDTSKVKTMEAMFRNCNVAELDLSNFNTPALENMFLMFYQAPAITSIKFGPNFTTANVTNMREVFQETSVTELDLSSFDTKNVTTMYQMFYDCTKLQKITVSENFVITDKLTDDTRMFGSTVERYNRYLVLEGGNGTKWADMLTGDPDNYTGKKYAVIDGVNGQRGYFTAATGVTVSSANVTVSVDTTVAESYTTPYIFLGEPITVTLTGVKEGVAEVTLTSTIGETSATATATVTEGTITIPAEFVTDGAAITISAVSATPETPSDTTGNEENNTTEPEATGGGTETASNEQESSVSEETTSPENVASDPVLPPSEGNEGAENGTDQTEGQQDQE